MRAAIYPAQSVAIIINLGARSALDFYRNGGMLTDGDSE